MNSPIPVSAEIKTEVKADITEAVNSGSRMAERTHKGLAKIIMTALDPWLASKERDATLLREQTMRDANAIKSGMASYRNGTFSISENCQSQMVDTLIQLLTHGGDSIRLLSVLNRACKKIISISECDVSDAPLSRTFFNHWRQEAELIDDDDFRDWWARILVEEVKRPNSISPRTLDVARNLSRDEAILFERLCHGVLGKLLISNFDGSTMNGSYADVMALQDAGLVGSQHAEIPIEVPESSFANYTIKTTSPNSDKAYLQAYSMTRAGIEILKTIQTDQTQEDLNKIAKIIEAQNDDTKVSIVFSQTNNDYPMPIMAGLLK